jgi:hypothetical protein
MDSYHINNQRASKHTVTIIILLPNANLIRMPDNLLSDPRVCPVGADEDIPRVDGPVCRGDLDAIL